MDERHLPGKVDWLGGQPPLLVRANIVMIGLRSDIDYGINRAVHFFSEYCAAALQNNCIFGN